MRPGQEAPDELDLTAMAVALDLASMRPGQEAPDEPPALASDPGGRPLQ